MVPADKDAHDVVSTAFSKYNISLGAGLSEVADKVFRIGHVGDMNDASMLDSGFDIKPGISVAAAIKYFRTTA